MGDRSQIVVRQTASQTDNLIIFYGHWSGTDNITAAKNVLERTGRIGDSYLTAQLFYEFTRLANYTGELGFGLWTGHIDSIDEEDNPAVFVDIDTGRITYKGQQMAVNNQS
jgi:hypothetical protein